LARGDLRGPRQRRPDTESSEVARERLLRATQSTKNVITATEAEIREKERALDDAQRRLSEVERSTPDAMDVANVAVRAALELPEIQQPLRRTAKELRLDPQAGRSRHQNRSHRHRAVHGTTGADTLHPWAVTTPSP
jgi:DNA repair ATPase RecN